MALLLVSRAASAQSHYNEGIGLRTGDLELHPGIQGQFGYDSNYFQRSDKQNVANGPPVAPIIPALEFLLTPSLYLTTLGPQRSEGSTAEPPELAFKAGINATYRELIGISSDPAASNTSNDASSQRNIGGAADARLDILPQRPLGGSIYASYSRAILPNTVAANPDQSFNQDTIGAGAEVALQPAAGTLDWHFGYHFAGTFFESTAGQGYNNTNHQAYTQGRWKFRPRTALIYDASASFVAYPNQTNAADVPLDAATPVRTRIGLEGLITDRFAATALIGWGASFYEFNPRIVSRPQFDSVIAKGELRWYLSASPGVARAAELGLTLSSIALGYTRDFQNSYLGSYYAQDRGYLKFEYLFAGRAVVTLEGGVAALEYPTIFWSDGSQRHSSFTDTAADGTLFSEYRFTDTFGVNLTFRYLANFSSTQLPVNEQATRGTNNIYDMGWQRFTAYLGVRWFL